MPDRDCTIGIDDERNFYGREYWFLHQEMAYGQPNITIRARTDLSERCLYWLRMLLKYKLPPANVLELGSAHGGFVALLRWAGFDATGLELSPWVVGFAEQNFRVPVLLGPVEQQKIRPASLDLIVLMDVLEHLPDPVGTMRHCLKLVKSDGILILQTPCYPEGKSYEDLVSEGHRFLEMLKEQEHLFLFSVQSIRDFFHRLGVDHLQFEPAIFAHYDMFLLVSKTPLSLYSQGEIDRALSSTPGGRMIQALFDVYERYQQLSGHFQESEADRAARLKVIESMGLEIKNLKKQLAQGEMAADTVRNSRAYRVLQKLRRWKLQERLLEDAFPTQKVRNPRRSADRSIKRLTRIAVDLTPVLPGGENGGAKLLTLELIRQLSRFLPESEFVLLTSYKSDQELSCLDSSNVQRLCVTKNGQWLSHPRHLLTTKTKAWIRKHLFSILPSQAYKILRSVRQHFGSGPRHQGLLRKINADLIFCPFTAPFYFDPGVPMVSIVYDLLYQYYPQNFDAHERLARDKNLRDVCRLADRIVCISDYVRGAVLEAGQLSPERVTTIPIRLFRRLERQAAERVPEILSHFRLKAGLFFLFPANFWPHKNHEMFLTAFGIYRSRHHESDMKLVFTGAPDGRMERLRQAAQRMGLESSVLFLGYTPDGEFSGLLQSCTALVFPSLHEGFGMPVLEAMAFDKPVICSNVTSLPETAGDAAFFIDPRKPAEIVHALERIENEPELVSELISRGRRHLAKLGDVTDMARDYLRVFQEAINGSQQFTQALHGVYPDGWTKERVVITYGPSSEQRHLELRLHTPSWAPVAPVLASVSQNGEGESEVFTIDRAQSVTIRRLLSFDDGYIELSFAPSFQAKAHTISQDDRLLGCIIEECAVVSPTGRLDLLQDRG